MFKYSTATHTKLHDYPSKMPSPSRSFAVRIEMRLRASARQAVAGGKRRYETGILTKVWVQGRWRKPAFFVEHVFWPIVYSLVWRIKDDMGVGEVPGTLVILQLKPLFEDIVMVVSSARKVEMLTPLTPLASLQEHLRQGFFDEVEEDAGEAPGCGTRGRWKRGDQLEKSNFKWFKGFSMF